MLELGQGLTLAQNVDWGFLLIATLPVNGIVTEPHYMQVPSQGVRSGEQASTYPGLSLIKGQQAGPSSLTGAWN
jgi:hypothetical protein